MVWVCLDNANYMYALLLDHVCNSCLVLDRPVEACFYGLCKILFLSPWFPLGFAKIRQTMFASLFDLSVQVTSV